MSDSILQITSKACSRCKQVKDLSMFSKDKCNPDGYRNRCKSCDKEYYEKNKEKQAIYKKKYRQENSQKINLRRCEYWKSNKERLSAQKKNYNERDRGTMEYALRRLLYSAKTRANQKNLPFDLTVEWLEAMVITHCPITLEPLNWTREGIIGGGPRTNSPSIDRIIPELGYVQSNCSIISARGNTIKNNGTLEEHLHVIQFMVAQQSKSITS